MTTNRSLASITYRFAGWAALIGIAAIAACNRAPTPPEKMAIAPAKPGTASGFALLRQDANADRNQEASENRFEVKTAYAFIDRSSPQYYDVVLLDKELDNQALAEATDPSDVVNEALQGGANGVVVMFDGDGDISGSFRMNANGKSVQFGGSGIGDVRGLARNGDRLTGHLHYFTSFFADHMAIDASFDAPLVVAPQGKPMPADGGEPGAAYLATVAAMREGDVDKLIALMPPEQAKMIEAERTKPDFAENIAMLKAMAPGDVQVTGGTSFGERVVLTTKGTEGNAPFTGTVEMKWVDGGWRMGNQSQRAGGGAASAGADEPKEPKATEAPTPDVVPVKVDDGVVGKGFMNAGTAFAPTEGFVVNMPAEFGENRLLLVMSEAKLDPANAKATWDEGTPLGKLFADGQAHPSLWLNLSRDERGEIKVDKSYFVDVEGGAEDMYAGFNAIEADGKLLGVLTQSGQVNDTKYEGVARFDLPVLPAP